MAGPNSSAREAGAARRLRCRPAALAALLVLLAGCDQRDEDAQAKAPEPPAVGFVRVGPQPVTRSFGFIGRVEAVDTVEIRARVEGQLLARHFTEGQEVEPGAALFSIERTLYAAEVAKAEAQVANDQAVLANAEAQLTRSTSLVQRNNIAQATVDTDRAARDQAVAQVALAEAALAQARLNLGYTEIAAPIGGKLGRVAYDVGNLVGPSSEPLVTLVSQDPIYVSFPVSTTELQAIRAERSGDDPDLAKIEFVLTFSNGQAFDGIGRWSFTSPQVDRSTDTVLMRAVFANPQRQLIDGQYANVTLRGREPQQRLVVPQASVQIRQSGTRVLLVDASNRIVGREVVLGPITGSLQVVERGLEAGERVVLEGLQRAREGEEVAPYEVTASGPGAAPPPGGSPAPAVPPQADAGQPGRRS